MARVKRAIVRPLVIVLRRARSYLALRADPELQGRVVAELEELVAEATALEQALAGEESTAT